MHPRPRNKGLIKIPGLSPSCRARHTYPECMAIILHHPHRRAPCCGSARAIRPSTSSARTMIPREPVLMQSFRSSTAHSGHADGSGPDQLGSFFRHHPWPAKAVCWLHSVEIQSMRHSLEAETSGGSICRSREQSVVQETNVVSLDVHRSKHIPFSAAVARGVHHYRRQTLELARAVRTAIIQPPTPEKSVGLWLKEDDAALF